MRDRVKPLIPWVMVETLAADAMSVTTVDGDTRGFANLQRVLQRLLTKTPALYDSITTAGLIKVIAAAARDAEYRDVEIPTGAGPYKLIARPVLGPDAPAHGVQFWLGSVAIAVSPPRLAIGMVWDLANQTIRQPEGMAHLSGIGGEQYRTEFSIAELFRQAIDFDRHGELLELLYRPREGDKLQFDLILDDPDGEPRQWRVAVRARDDAQCRGAYWLWEEIAADEIDTRPPTLEQVALREAHRRAGTHLAAVQTAHTSIVHWLTEPAPWIRWENLSRPVEVFHPDDRPALRALANRSRRDDAAEMTVRTLGHAGDYLSTTMLLYPYPGRPTGELMIGQLVKAADGVPAAQPPPAAEEQVCHRGSGRILRSRPHGPVPKLGNR